MRLGGFPAIHIAKYNEERASKIVIDFIAEKQGKNYMCKQLINRKENVGGVQHFLISDFSLMEF